MIPHLRVSLQKLRLRLRNYFASGESIDESKQKWNALAQKNARYFVLSSFGEGISEDRFREEGRNDYERLIESDEFLGQLLGDFKQKTVLEIGCGLGRLTEFLADTFKEVVGVDISENMVAQAAERLSDKRNIRLLVGDGQRIILPDDSVDFVFSYIVFQHMPDVATVKQNLAEVSRVLKVGGVAKIQLRGVEVSKKEWFYGPSFTHAKVAEMLAGLPVRLVREYGEGKKYYWITLIKG